MQWLVFGALSSRARIVWYVVLCNPKPSTAFLPNQRAIATQQTAIRVDPVLPNRVTTPVLCRVARARPTQQAEHQHTRQNENKWYTGLSTFCAVYFKIVNATKLRNDTNAPPLLLDRFFFVGRFAPRFASAAEEDPATSLISAPIPVQTMHVDESSSSTSTLIDSQSAPKQESTYEMGFYTCGSVFQEG